MTMPKNLLISGTGGLVAQRGEHLFRLLARYLEVQGVRAEVDLVAPDKLAGRADPDLRKSSTIVPTGEDPLASQVRKVGRPGMSIVEGQFQAIGRQDLNVSDLSHFSVPPNTSSILPSSGESRKSSRHGRANAQAKRRQGSPVARPPWASPLPPALAL